MASRIIINHETRLLCIRRSGISTIFLPSARSETGAAEAGFLFSAKWDTTQSGSFCKITRSFKRARYTLHLQIERYVY